MRLPAVTRVLVVTPLGQGGQGGIDRLMDEVRCALRDHPRSDVRVAFATTRGRGHIAGSTYRVPAVWLRLAGRALGRGPDIVHINLSSHGSALRKISVAWMARRFAVPYVIHLHGSGFREYWLNAPVPIQRAIHTMFAGAARTLVLGSVWRDLVAERVPEAADHIIILPNAVPIPRPRAARDGLAPVILFLGNLGPRKGVPQLVEALAQLPRSCDWTAVIAGNGEVEETRTSVARNGLADRVCVPGWVGPDEVRRYLATSDILVLPSFEENLPMSVIEGMANGLAVVTTPVGAVEDIVSDGRTGLLVPAGDVPALGRALTLLIKDPMRRAAIGAAARNFHRSNLELGAYVDRLIAIWKDAIATPHASCPGTSTPKLPVAPGE